MSIQVNAALFRAVYTCVSTEETRYYLNGVFVEPHPTHGALLVSTDGHRMLVAHDATGNASRSAIIQFRAEQLKALKHSRRENPYTLRIELTDKAGPCNATVAESEGAQKVAFPVCEIDGAYPDWRRVVPQGPFRAQSTPTFNGAYLASLMKAGDELRSAIGATSQYMSVFFADAESPALIRWSDVANAFGLMPVRSSMLPELPAFMTDVLRRAAE